MPRDFTADERRRYMLIAKCQNSSYASFDRRSAIRLRYRPHASETFNRQRAGIRCPIEGTPYIIAAVWATWKWTVSEPAGQARTDSIMATNVDVNSSSSAMRPAVVGLQLTSHKLPLVARTDGQLQPVRRRCSLHAQREAPPPPPLSISSSPGRLQRPRPYSPVG
jgi:hypothetical protein